MRTFRRRSEVVSDDEAAPQHMVGETEAEPEVVEETDVSSYRWTPASILIAFAGAALAVVGLVGLNRAEVNSTWYRPVVEVANIDHTPLLAAIEVGVGVVVAITALAGARTITALVLATTAVAALVVAIDPQEVTRELAIERSWAIALAIAAAALAVLSVMPWPVGADRRHRVVRRHHRYGPAQQH